ncbi:NodT family efflux transporter outer membrane factor (OMF) lipoprotein [Flavobacterium gossypii]|uniref:NodT family efflux transporter outer membrane factor (OMF) lipoprotein n=2 Tax=Flavobacterium TaxID=237 RepID=A0A495MJS3_9FLAO|nr:MULTISPECIES: efflux transporter outer membrane subunit [Flavobacterium]MBA9073191.1 NodT family efflux transporter outer membrane factor (OMF) lipoprotein [Flavobacterium gossypii]RKS26217.1 NodT family efflux transporter outer membrane factor (OMF) lipoprotein [Flavobacterium endophyticum]WDO13656.1 efflux transporter outer membrane subunit [Flavobacterium sp. WW92]
MKNKIYKISLLVLAAVVMQSCFVAKKYDRPEMKTEDLYRTEVVSTDSTSLANVSWDKVFTDPILQGHIKKGLQNNLDIRIAMQNIVAAEATMKQGKAGYFPTLSGNADWTHQQLSKNSQLGSFLQDRSTDQYQLTGTLSWEADIWGKIRSNKRAANAAYLQTIAANQAVKTQLIANIASTYYQLLSMDAQIKVAEQTLINRNESIETILALKDAGNVNEVGVKQTEAQKYATEIIIADLKNNVIILENALSILLGESPRKIERSTLEDQAMQPEITLGVPATLLRNRPDVIAAEYNLISTFEQTNVARSNFYPTFKVTATGGFQSIDLQQWFSANSFFANVVTGLTQPIFNQRQIKTRFEVAKANQEKAYLQFEQSLLTAGREVSDALAQYNNETAKITIREKQVDALKKAADYSDELLTYGLVNYLEVLTAKDNALNTELNLIDNKYKQYNAIIQLYRALGGGWQ